MALMLRAIGLLPGLAGGSLRVLTSVPCGGGRETRVAAADAAAGFRDGVAAGGDADGREDDVSAQSCRPAAWPPDWVGQDRARQRGKLARGRPLS